MFNNSNFDEHQYERYDDIREKIVNEIPQKHYNNILEIGCGCGHMAEILAKKIPNAKVVGIDIVEDYINTAKNLFNDSLNLEFLCQDYKDLNSKFDMIVMFNAFTELLKVDNINEIIKYFDKIANENALIVIADEFDDDYKKDFALTRSINELIGYKYLKLKKLSRTCKRYDLIKNKLYELEGQVLNIEGIAHYISYECMLNYADNTFKLKPIEIWNKKKKEILKQGHMKINSKIRLCIFRRK